MVSTRARSKFHYFLRLPPEIRLQIWDLTLPEPRIIVSHYRSLRPMYHRWSAYEDYAKKTVDLGIIRAYPNLETPFPDATCFCVPTALHVCRESRAQALRTYVPVLPSEECSKAKALYVDPQRDVLLIDSLRLRSRVVLGYGVDLGKFETLFVRRDEWNYVVPAGTENERRIREYSRREEIKKLLCAVKNIYHTQGTHESSWCGCPRNCITWEDPAIEISKMTRPGLLQITRKRTYDQWVLTGAPSHPRPKKRETGGCGPWTYLPESLNKKESTK